MTFEEANNHLHNARIGCLIDDKADKDLQKMCVLALEKQIPKKPILEGDGYWNGEIVFNTWFCPTCDSDYETEYDQYNHCPYCGQAIDWSEDSGGDADGRN